MRSRAAGTGPPAFPRDRRTASIDALRRDETSRRASPAGVGTNLRLLHQSKPVNAVPDHPASSQLFRPQSQRAPRSAQVEDQRQTITHSDKAPCQRGRPHMNQNLADSGTPQFNPLGYRSSGRFSITPSKVPILARSSGVAVAALASDVTTALPRVCARSSSRSRPHGSTCLTPADPISAPAPAAMARAGNQDHRRSWRTARMRA